MQNALCKLFWFTDPSELDLSADKELIVHQTLALGSLRDIRLLLHLYSRATIRAIFLKGKKGFYDPRAVAFAKELLGIKRLNYSRYIKYVRS
ncbi:MAG: hypothetical protein HYS98_05560 [Deltaproteobacteria bacterium]|nr:hypothetical protein [Deltaproteobacteria bacterium]